MSTLATEKTPKKPQKFSCNICYFFTSNKKDFERHVLTKKHKMGNCQQKSTKLPQITPHDFTCENCNKTYKERTGLWRHKKKCIQENNVNFINLCEIIDQKKGDVNDNVDHKLNLLNEMFQAQLRENQDFKDMMLEQNKTMIELCKEKSITMNNNSNNKTFNLQVFLNETCKDAMNIMDFANSLKIHLSDLENVGTIGYIDGITNIVVKNLKKLDISKRPLHCSDIKREVLYIKDQDKWEKENDDKDTLRQAIKHIAHKNIQMIPEWKRENPDYKLDEGKANDKYLKIIMNSMGGSDKQENIVYENKIISKIAKTVTINKDS